MITGRPTDYTPEKADMICSYISDGLSLRTICAKDGMPSMQTIFTWLRKHPEFVEQYTRAKEEQAEAMIEDMLDISDNITEDYCTVVKNGQEIRIVDKEHINRSRLRVDTRKWIASKLKPKKYGDKIDITSDGEKLKTPPSEISVRLVKCP